MQRDVQQAEFGLRTFMSRLDGDLLPLDRVLKGNRLSMAWPRDSIAELAVFG